MSQSSLPNDASMYAPNDAPRGLPAPLAWPIHQLDRLRQSVLPDADAPQLPPTAPAPANSVLPSRARRMAGLVPATILALVALALLLAVSLFGFRQLYDGRIYPAVAVADVPIGGLTAAEAGNRLAERAATLERQTLTFTYGELTWTPTLAEVGGRVDLDTSIANAMALGRRGDATSRLAFTGALLDADQQAAPLYTDLDGASLDAWFDGVDADIGNLAVDARLTMENGTVAIADEAQGVAVDREAVTAQILASLATLATRQPAPSELPTRVDEPVFTRANLTPVQATIERMIAEPVEVTYGDDSWRFEGAMLGPYLLVDTALENGEPAAVLDIDTDGLAAALRAEVGDEINRPPVDAVLGWDDGVVALEPSSAGVTIQGGAFADAVADSFLNSHQPVEIPVILTRPEIDGENLDALGIDTLLGDGSSNYAGGVEERDVNVELASEFMNGTLVPPGGIFSFNDAIGEITYERGFQEALVVQGEGVGRDVGGGVCQVSTTIFRAALNAGMPITEWYAHTYRLPDYERDGWGPGFDASILQWGPDPAEWPDFEFENYTDGWLLVESSIAYPYVNVNIYGSGDGRSVIIDAWDMGNNAFAFSRVIHDAQGNVIADLTFESHFK